MENCVTLVIRSKFVRTAFLALRACLFRSCSHVVKRPTMVRWVASKLGRPPHHRQRMTRTTHISRCPSRRRPTTGLARRRQKGFRWLFPLCESLMNLVCSAQAMLSRAVTAPSRKVKSTVPTQRNKGTTSVLEYTCQLDLKTHVRHTVDQSLLRCSALLNSQAESNGKLPQSSCVREYILVRNLQQHEICVTSSYVQHRGLEHFATLMMWMLNHPET